MILRRPPLRATDWSSDCSCWKGTVSCLVARRGRLTPWLSITTVNMRLSKPRVLPVETRISKAAA